MSNSLELAKKLIELRLALRRACMCEDGDKALLSLKTKALFVIAGAETVSPSQLMAELKIVKPNLTVLAKELEKDELIIRTHTLIDRRAVLYGITAKGRAYLEERIARIADNLRLDGLTESVGERAGLSMDEVLRFLSEVGI